MGNTQSKVQEDDVHFGTSFLQHWDLEDLRGNRRRQEKKGFYTPRRKEKKMDAIFRSESMRLEILARRKNYWSFLNE